MADHQNNFVPWFPPHFLRAQVVPLVALVFGISRTIYHHFARNVPLQPSSPNGTKMSEECYKD